MSIITSNLHHAVTDLLAGKPVAIPTETVYGLAAMITNERAIKAVFEMKNRPLNHPLIVHIAAHWDINQLVEEMPDYANRLIAAFWPGPLTFVFRAKMDIVNPLITGGQTTVAIRCPAHPLTQELLKELNTPVVAPSANPFGKVSPTTAEHVLESFPNEELCILNGGRCSVGIESTIIDASNPQAYQILRHGMIDESAIAKVVSTPCLNKENSIRVPGKLESHYQPEKNLYYFEAYDSLAQFCAKREGEVYVIASKEPPKVEKNLFHLLSSDPDTAAYELYFQLRKGDASHAICIAIELPPASTEWQGVRERILKAGTPYSC